jgi:signal transduction histidine kinase
LRNLYENAVKYSPGGGAIRTTASIEDDMVAIHVADSGIGIAADDIDRVFGRFHRVGADPAVRGMGLGLYLCHHLVEAQGGHIAATSPGPGLGATFSVALPLARDWGDKQEAKTSDGHGGG